MTDNEKNIIFEYFNKIHVIPTRILDIGCYDCTDSIEFTKYWPRCQIYAFEPIEEAIQLAKEKIEEYKNIELIKLLLSDADGYQDMYKSYGGSLASSSVKKPVKHLEIYQDIKFSVINNIKTKTLDSWIKSRNFDYIDIMWIDINGGEKKIF